MQKITSMDDLLALAAKPEFAQMVANLNGKRLMFDVVSMATDMSLTVERAVAEGRLGERSQVTTLMRSVVLDLIAVIGRALGLDLSGALDEIDPMKQG